MSHPLYYPVVILHFLLTIFMMFGWVFNNKTVLQILFLLLVFGISLFVLLDGCFLTKFEKKLSNGKSQTVIDPILMSLGISLNRETRSTITLFLYTISIIITSYKLFLRKDQPTQTDTENPTQN